MKAKKQIAPQSAVEINEEAEFRALAARTDARQGAAILKALEAERVRIAKDREAAQREARIVNNFKLMLVGVIVALLSMVGAFTLISGYSFLSVLSITLTAAVILFGACRE